MNLFSARLRRRLMTTAQFEAHVEKLMSEMKRYREIEQSAELKEYNELKALVESVEFATRKKYLNRRYSETDESKTLKRLASMLTIRLQGYFTVQNWEIYKEYVAFKESADYALLADRKQRRSSSKLRRMYIWEHSRAYLNYLNIERSAELKEYLALKAETETADFKERDAFWRNPKRWETTDEAKKEARYKELAASADIRFYLGKDEKEVDRMEQYKMTLAEDFKDLKNWQAGFGYAAPLKSLFSRVDEEQAYTGGKNVSVAGGCLTIETRRENAKAQAWDEKRGFVEREYAYTSDVLNTSAVLSQNEGVFVAKVRVEGKLHHALSLSDGKNKTLVSLFHFDGKQLTVGAIVNGKREGTVVTGINPSEYYIYGLTWVNDELVWYVNNMEVYRLKIVVRDRLFLVAQSFMPTREKCSTGRMNVEWVRVLHK